MADSAHASHIPDGEVPSWTFTRDDIAAPPSCSNDPNNNHFVPISAEEEAIARQKATSHVFRLAALVRMSIYAAASACYYVQRFYMYQTVQQFPPRMTAVAALSVASKVALTTRNRHICTYVPRDTLVERSYWLANRDVGASERELPRQSERFKRECRQVDFTERVLVASLGFDLSVELPHDYILHLQGDEKLFQELWSTANTMLAHKVLLLHDAREMVAGMLQLAHQQQLISKDHLSQLLRPLGVQDEKALEACKDIQTSFDHHRKMLEQEPEQFRPRGEEDNFWQARDRDKRGDAGKAIVSPSTPRSADTEQTLSSQS